MLADSPFLKFKGVVLQIVLFSACSGNAQEYKTRIDYIPLKKEEVSSEQYRKAIYILEQTYTAIKKDSFEINYADHLNIAHAYAMLMEPKGMIFSELKLAQEKDLKSTAAVFILGVKSPNHFRLTQSEYDSLEKKFKMIYEGSKEEESQFNLDTYITEGGYEKKLVKSIALIEQKDQEHRTGDQDLAKQYKIDKENMVLIDSLYGQYKTYIGKSLVGDKFDHVMWLVVQHSDLATQERYLGVIHEAVISNELNSTPLKMLIDRIYSKKYGYQIFGSQAGVGLGNDKEIADVKLKYGIQ